jgi:D-aminoacyl-tRNA deacylase
MILLLQRVSKASVRVDRQVVGSIGHGLLAFVAVEPGDDSQTARKLVDRAAAYRVFNDTDGKMNLGLQEVGGELLLVSQFTLAADTGKGLRPSFTTAAPPELGRRLFQEVVDYAQAKLPGRVATGRFGADMKVTLVNDGPVTFLLRFSATSATGTA